MALKVTNVERFMVRVPFTPGQQAVAERTVYNLSLIHI